MTTCIYPISPSYCPTLPPRHKSANAKWKWSGWQELNLREHVPKTCGWPATLHPDLKRGPSALSCLALDADNVAQRVEVPRLLHQSRCESSVDFLVSAGMKS